MSRDTTSSSAPPHLAGTLLLRGRKRLIWTGILLGAGLVIGPLIQLWLGEHSNAFVASVALVLAWFWGRIPGGLMTAASVLLNAVWAREAGLIISAWSSIAFDAVAIGTVGFIVGHVGTQLERVLGARARVNEAYDELEIAARDRMLTITDQVPVGLYRTTPDGTILGGNDTLMRILGYSDRESMLAANVLSHYADARDRDFEYSNRTPRGQLWRDIRLNRADGSPIWVRDWAVAVLNEEGEATHYDGVLEDITEQHLAEERFRAAFDDSPYGMTISRTDGYLVRGNAAIAELLRIPLDELTNIHFSQFTFEDEMDITPKALAKATAGEVVRYEKRLRRRDGSFFWALISLAPIHDGSNPQLFISHVIDITERRRAQEGLENLVRSKDELIASVSHELRTPLTVVHGLAQELDVGWVTFSVPEQKEFIGMIAQQSAEVAHIVEDLLVAARADIGKLPIHPVSLDLRDEIDAVVPTIPDLNVDQESVGAVAPVAFADPGRVRQVVRNLLSNACRYGGTEITVRFGVAEERAWIEVADSGSEIPPSEVVKIFEPYQRAHNAAGQPMSVGLGLTVSRTLAELMGGALSYRYEDNWSVFRLELPIPGAIHTGR